MASRARSFFDNGVLIEDVDPEIVGRFAALCDRRGVTQGKMFETMVRSFDRGSTTYTTDMRMDFGKYAGMLVEDVIRTDPRYMRWLVNTSEWFKLKHSALVLLESME
jgi:hypothetical protein